MVATADALAAAEAELLRLRNAVEQWLADANAASADLAQLQADLAALQQQVQQLAGSDGQVAAHTHQISEVQGLATALAAKLADANGVIQQHHIASGAITATHIADGAISAAKLDAAALGVSGQGYQQLPSGVIIQWGVRTGVSVGNTAVNITWPISFTVACESVVAQVSQLSVSLTSATLAVSADNISKTGCTIKSYTSNVPVNANICWLAIGR